jgi:hypothetical protein
MTVKEELIYEEHNLKALMELRARTRGIQIEWQEEINDIDRQIMSSRNRISKLRDQRRGK